MITGCQIRWGTQSPGRCSSCAIYLPVKLNWGMRGRLKATMRKALSTQRPPSQALTSECHGLDFPGGPVVKHPSTNSGHAGSIPGLGRFHVFGATKPMCTGTTEPLYSRARVPQKEKPQLWEVCPPHLESSSCSLQLEKVLVQQQRPSAAKNKQIQFQKVKL